MWKEIPGYPGYRVSDSGQIWSNKTKKTLKLIRSKDGYCHVFLYCNGDGSNRKMRAHRAVLLAFVGPPLEGHESRHLDGNPSNNVLDNLSWGTRLENARDRQKHGRCPNGFDSPSAKLTPDNIPIIRSLQDIQPSRTVAKRFNVSHTTILEIWRNHRWEDY